MSATSRGGQRSEADNYPTPSWCVRRFLEAFIPRFPPYAGICGGKVESLGRFLGHRWIEPFAGEGAIIRATNAYFVQRWGAPAIPHWSAIELRAECEAPLLACVGEIGFTGRRVLCPANTFTTNLALLPARHERDFDLAMSNPPFSLAEEAVRWCIEGTVPLANHTALLLPLDFVATSARAAWHRTRRPDLYLLPNRPSFALSARCQPPAKGPKFTGCGHHWLLPATAATPDRCPACGAGRKTLAFSRSDAAEYAWFHWGPGADGRIHWLAETSKDERRAG